MNVVNRKESLNFHTPYVVERLEPWDDKQITLVNTTPGSLKEILVLSTHPSTSWSPYITTLPLWGSVSFDVYRRP